MSKQIYFNVNDNVDPILGCTNSLLKNAQFLTAEYYEHTCHLLPVGDAYVQELVPVTVILD